jgi:hypothetical protein
MKTAKRQNKGADGMFGTPFQKGRRICTHPWSLAVEMLLCFLPVVCLFWAQLTGPAIVFAQTPLGTEFTYQGQLLSGELPIDGNCDLRFSLFDEETDGTLIGDPVVADAITIRDGRFTAVLDFGSDAFDGSARWLEIAVRCPDGPGSYTTLSPRQLLTAVPYALAGRMAAKTLTLGPTAFSSPFGGNPSYYSAGWLTPASRDFSTTTWVTNIDLPEGATVRRIRCYWIDEETSPLDLNAGVMRFRMRRRRPDQFPAEWQTMAEAEIDTTGWTRTVPWTLLDDSVAFAVIETERYLYELYFSFTLHPGGTSESFVHFGGCQVEYRTTGLP